LYELDKKLSLISIVVEGFEDSNEDNLDGDDDEDGPRGDDGGTNEDEDDEPDQMETDKRSEADGKIKTQMQG
jgi:hypothetical protein